MGAVVDSPYPLVALVGNPNCGKTALFNILTGSRQKVANYAGVTVERKEGMLRSGSARVRILDLPGAYSLDPVTPDEQVTVDTLLGRSPRDPAPDFVVCVTDATNLRQNLRLVLSIKRLGLPMVVCLNMIDIARRKGLAIDSQRLAAELGVPVVETVGVKVSGANALTRVLACVSIPLVQVSRQWQSPTQLELEQDQTEVRRILGVVGGDRIDSHTFSDRVDAVVLHPFAGPLILALILFLVFQAVFAWAQLPMDAVKWGVTATSDWLGSLLPTSLFKDLLVNGVLAGVGSVLVFLPQIIILFFFILVLEDSGYLPRAAFLLDRVMGSVGLSGRAFIPLLSSFACAIPGIMATRTIQNPRDRLVTIMIAPLMTCSARLPVYALIIGAFIPRRAIWGGLQLQGIVLFALYIAGVVSAMAVAYVLKKTGTGSRFQSLMLELPAYHWPNLRHLGSADERGDDRQMLRLDERDLALSTFATTRGDVALDAVVGDAAHDLDHLHRRVVLRADAEPRHTTDLRDVRQSLLEGALDQQPFAHPRRIASNRSSVHTGGSSGRRRRGTCLISSSRSGSWRR